MIYTLEEYREKYGLKKRKLKLMNPTNLKYSDTGELMVLLSHLGKTKGSKIHVKINDYLRISTGATSVVIDNARSFHCKVHAIGVVPLESPLILDPSSSFFQLSHRTIPHWVERSEIEGVLCCHLEHVLWKEGRERFVNCFMIPINRTHRPRVLFHILLVNVKIFFRCEEYYVGIVRECFSLCIGHILSSCNYEDKKQQRLECEAMVMAYTKIMSSIGTDLIYDIISKQSMKMFDSSDCLMYLVNVNSKPYLKSSFLKSNGLLIYKDENKLLSQHVLKNFSFFCDNLREEPLYEFCEEGLPPRSVIAFRADDGKRPLALLEVYFKSKIKIDYICKEKALALSSIIARALHTHDDYVAFISQRERLAFSDCLLLRRIKLSDNSTQVKHIQQCHLLLDYHRFYDLRFDSTMVPEEHTLCVCYKIVLEMGLLKAFHIKESKFARFLLFVKNAYNALPFHNWTQGFSAFHFIFCIMNQLNLIKNKYITLLEALALLVASLCHCLDCRGSTTPFTLLSGAVQASLFSSPGSLAQAYYASQILRLMNFPECNFLEHLPDEMFNSFAILLIDMIKDSDIAHNAKKISLLEKFKCNEYNFNNWNHRRLIHNVLINMSQLNFIVKPWSYCRMIGESCFNEFYRKGDLSYASDVYESTDLNEDILKLPEISMQFIKSIGLPTFCAFAHIFPVMSSSIKKIEENLKNWEAEKEKILVEMAKEALGAGGGEGDEVALINPFAKNQ